MRARSNLLKKIALITIAALVWVGLVSIGFAVVYRHEATPAPGASVATEWPPESSLPRPIAKPALLMFAHPRCPCTRATVQELSRLVAQSGKRADAMVLFHVTEGQEAEISGSALWQEVVAIPGVKAIADVSGREASFFGPVTSGHTLLYDSYGKLIFEGGITSSRGHEGDNAGRSSIVSALLNETPEAEQTPVFGCALVAEAPPLKQGEKPCCK